MSGNVDPDKLLQYLARSAVEVAWTEDLHVAAHIRYQYSCRSFSVS